MSVLLINESNLKEIGYPAKIISYFLLFTLNTISKND